MHPVGCMSGGSAISPGTGSCPPGVASGSSSPMACLHSNLLPHQGRLGEEGTPYPDASLPELDFLHPKMTRNRVSAHHVDSWALVPPGEPGPYLIGFLRRVSCFWGLENHFLKYLCEVMCLAAGQSGQGKGTTLVRSALTSRPGGPCLVPSVLHSSSHQYPEGGY